MQTQALPLTFPGNILHPVLQFNFGFSTDETNSSDGFLDSWSFTLQSNDGLATALILSADASGVAWAPPNPGGLLLDPNNVVHNLIPVPAYAQGLHTTFAYSISFLVPTNFVNTQATLYLDLFDNLIPPNSLGWADNIAIVVPEPDILPLGLLVATSLFLTRRPSHASRISGDD